MRIEAVDLFYLCMPEITTEADGSQDPLLVRAAPRRPCPLGRMRGLAASVDRRFRLSDVARHLPAGLRVRAG